MDNKRKRKISIKTKILVPVVIINIMICVIMGAVLSMRMSKSMAEMGSQQATMTVQFVADKLNGDDIAELKKGDENTDKYKEIADVLKKAKEDTAIKYIYTLYTDKNNVYFGVDADLDKSIGDLYIDSYEVLKDAFDGKIIMDLTIYKTPDGDLINSCIPIKDSNNNVVALLGCDYNAEDIVNKINTNKKIIFILTVVCIVISSFISSLIIAAVTKGLRKVDEKIYDLVHNKGDLTQTIDIKSGDELEIIGDNFNSLLGYIKDIMINISNSSENINNSSKKVADSIIESENSVTDISATMEEMSASMEETTASINQINSLIEETYKFIENIHNLAIEENNISKSKQNDAEEIRLNAVNMQEKAKEDANRIIEKVNNKIKKSRAVDRITELTDNILGITNQTSMLALNASIEAARAGEVGKGFAVVADEISKLANSSADIVTQINAVSTEVIKSVDELASEAKSMLDFMDKIAMSGFEALVETSDKYSTNAVEMYMKMQEFSESSKILKKNMDDIRYSINTVNAAAEESAKGIQNIAEKTTELTKNVEDISREAQENQNISGELNNEVNKFKLQ